MRQAVAEFFRCCDRCPCANRRRSQSSTAAPAARDLVAKDRDLAGFFVVAIVVTTTASRWGTNPAEAGEQPMIDRTVKRCDHCDDDGGIRWQRPGSWPAIGSSSWRPSSFQRPSGPTRQLAVYADSSSPQSGELRHIQANSVPSDDRRHFFRSASTYARPGPLAQLLDIAAQRTDDIEVLIAEDQAIKTTRREIVVERMRDRIPALRHWRNDVRLSLIASMVSSPKPRSDYCWLVSDDDLIEPGGVAAVIAGLREHGPVTGVTVNRNNF